MSTAFGVWICRPGYHEWLRGEPSTRVYPELKRHEVGGRLLEYGIHASVRLYAACHGIEVRHPRPGFAGLFYGTFDDDPLKIALFGGNNLVEADDRDFAVRCSSAEEVVTSRAVIGRELEKALAKTNPLLLTRFAVHQRTYVDVLEDYAALYDEVGEGQEVCFSVS